MARHAFVWGSNGSAAFDRLQFAVEDARRVAEELRRPRFQFTVTTPGFPGDPYSIKRELDKLAKSCRPEDAFVCYFSGHGELFRGGLMLVLDDTVPGDETTYFRVSWNKEAHDLCVANNKLIILDCCHAGAAAGGKGGIDVAELGLGSKTDLMLLASRRLEIAREFEYLKGSFLATEMCAFLGQAQTGTVTLRDLMRHLHDKAHAHNRQPPPGTRTVPIPFLHGDQQGEFFFSLATYPDLSPYFTVRTGGVEGWAVSMAAVTALETALAAHPQQNQEDKIACLVRLHSQVHAHDSQPDPPPSFLQPRRVQRLIQQMRGGAGEQGRDESESPEEADVVSPAAEVQARSPGPQKRLRTCVASMVDSHAFAPRVAAEAQERDFFRASRRAFVSDGAAYNRWIQRAYFSDFEPIADFLHVLCYLYLATYGVGGEEAARWSLYEGWLRWCWQGRAKEVIAALEVWQGCLREPPEGEEVEPKDPRQLVSEALSYMRNNQERMANPHYRRQGLPITSSLVESLVGEFNARVKSVQKYWNRPAGGEAMLQLRAALLSEDDRLVQFFAQRPGNSYRRRKVA